MKAVHSLAMEENPAMLFGLRSCLAILLTVAVGLAGVSLRKVSASTDPAMLTLANLRTEYKEDPLGIDAPEPRLSWQILANRRGVTQAAYQVRVARSERDLRSGKNLLWDTSRVASEESTLVPYKGAALQSGQRYYWQVRVWDTSGRESTWSDVA